MVPKLVKGTGGTSLAWQRASQGPLYTLGGLLTTTLLPRFEHEKWLHVQSSQHSIESWILSNTEEHWHVIFQMEILNSSNFLQYHSAMAASSVNQIFMNFSSIYSPSHGANFHLKFTLYERSLIYPKADSYKFLEALLLHLQSLHDGIWGIYPRYYFNNLNYILLLTLTALRNKYL